MVVTDPQPTGRTRVAVWDSRALLLRGDDRTHLCTRVAELVAFLERSPASPLPELAATLADELLPGGVRLGIVAHSTADLLAKLRRVAERLTDEKCRQVRDASGIYFTESPLASQGTLALLFPGEGAQYPNMLADLCGVFPVVEETFAWCDRLAAEVGQPSLRKVLHVPMDATTEEKEAAEAELRQLGPSIFGVLSADLAIARILRQLQLPVTAVAGHSAGELAALLEAGAIQGDGMEGAKFGELIELMQRQEGEAGGPDITLLAAGAGKSTVNDIASENSASSVYVAMDNCPHQCVVVGPSEEVAGIEAALVERGVICERLPFRRPYHTPLFEPWMAPFRSHFAGVPFAVPHTPVYCCSTGKLFPSDPNAIRTMAVNHWINPVEFAAMVARMHADGVRLFVEAGPRGNLSAFAEDVLRGKSFAAIPANLPRKSGPTQINHLVAQLAVHGVPLDLHSLFIETPGRTEWMPRSPSRNGVCGFPQPMPLEAPDAFISSYFAVMEQFLDVQRDVMQAFFTGTNSPAVAEARDEPARFALVGTFERCEPGRDIVFRHTLDLREDLYADHHTLGGRGVSRVDPGQNGLPVLPMTFSLEAMAEAASLLVPGKVVVGLRNIRLYRWVPFDAVPTTLEVRASVVAGAAESGTIEVKADVRDLGNSFLKDGANKPASEAVVVLADRYPEPPDPLPFALADEAPCRATVADLRRNMFHGPLFQMIRCLDRFGKEGIEGTLEVQPRTEWFRSNPDPRIVLDPVLIDAAMHILGAWHLEQPDWSGRILLPIGVNAVEVFGPTPAIGNRLRIRGHNEEETARQVRHGLEVFDESGRVWLRLRGASYWRFYLPFGEVNFFGPKDNYFLSQHWDEAVPPGVDFARCYFLDPPLDLRQPVLRASGVRVSMTPREIAEYNAVAADDAAANDWYFSRLVAKDAVRGVRNLSHSEAIFPADMETELHAGRMVIRPRGNLTDVMFPAVAVAVCEGKIAAFAAAADQLGIGLVILAKGVDAEAERAARMQAACRAAADACRADAREFAVTGEAAPGLLLVTHSGASAAIRVQTARRQDAVIATTLCEPGTR